ncbi:hypothetical protein SERLA73DRAFT_45333 [Serpula lacrymans var. lacrymans S7.3]|uniref:RNA helicase n=1 Tax=Serpula lacrymans var. lacrymans (strain S7.3) TaxID=936435 RepID=F8PIG4_SERL3|nr:hypothetical protein SERLA73DRAFT_45333 [Serpula lacrymans var. lacrymans S7.3]
MSRASEAHALSLTPKSAAYNTFKDDVLQEAHPTFEAVGIKPSIASILRAAFPNVDHPTTMQKKIIPAVLGQKDILIQDYTGTGKSFALLLALLSKQRVKVNAKSNDATPKKSITTLLIVPHRDLAYQFLHWAHQLATPTDDGSAPFSLSSTLKILVRGSSPENLPSAVRQSIVGPTEDGVSALRDDPPHILIGTPQAIQDMLAVNPHVLQLSSLSTVVVDEVDSQLEWASSHASKANKEKVKKKGDKHPKALKQLLDMLYPPHSRDTNPLESARTPAFRPQLIVLSATLRNRLRTAFFGEFGWFRRGNVLKLVKSGSKSRASHGANRSTTHHVLVVSDDDGIRNIRGARTVKTANSTVPIASEALNDMEEGDEDDAYFLLDDDDMLESDGDETLGAVSVINPAVLDAVAATFALDVPSIALLVLPPTASVRRTVFDLRALGVNAHGMDLTADEAGRFHLLSKDGASVEESPTLLVSTLSTTRGIDLPALTHVFLVGIPDGRMADSYLHVAGRVSRFGRNGKVITVLEDRQEVKEKKKVRIRDEPKKMALILRQLGIIPAKLEHFD